MASKQLQIPTKGRIVPSPPRILHEADLAEDGKHEDIWIPDDEMVWVLAKISSDTTTTPRVWE